MATAAEFGLKEQIQKKQIEKQMGCMAGFLQLFDRHQFITGNGAKRLYSPKRLPPTSPSSVTDTTSESEKSAPPSPAVSIEARKVRPAVATPSPERKCDLPPKSPIPIFELKQGTKSSWKFAKEAPRLSLDSRATTDAKGGLHPKEIRTTTASILSAGNRCDSNASDATDGSLQNRSPSVIARLMGLEPLPNSIEVEKKPELRRSASESRVSRDLFQSRFTGEGNGFYSKQQVVDSAPVNADPKAEQRGGNYNSLAPWKAPVNRKSYYDSGDVFPEPKQSVSIYGEIEKRLRMRGIEEPSRDLDTLKQILEALQLKGLLHSRKPTEQSHRNFVYEEPPYVIMKPARMSSGPSPTRRNVNTYSPVTGGNQNQVRRSNSPTVSPRRERNVKSPVRASRSTSPTTRNEANAGSKRSNSLVKPRPLSIETQRRMNETQENRRVSPVQSPKPSPRRSGPDPTVRKKKMTGEKIKTAVIAEDESSLSSVSGSSFSTSTDTEKSKTEYREGRTLLERCDKLLSSIAEMNSTDMQQPSPVSVLDSTFYYRDESLTPSPVTSKRNIDFKDQSPELDDELWSPVISPSSMSKSEELSDDCDFVYISDILRASHYLPEDSDVFSLLEKQQYLKGNDTSKVPRLQRKLIFDTINEILNRSRQLPPWKQVDKNFSKLSFEKIWSEFQKIREHETSEDLFEIICGVLKKDLAEDALTGWGDCPVEMSEAVLDIERLIFKDIISETIQDLAADATLSSVIPRRKLVF